MAEEIHSTAVENAVTRTDKFGHSMPILRPVSVMGSQGTWAVEHEGTRVGYITKTAGDRWWGRRVSAPNVMRLSGESTGYKEHPNKHSAAASLFDPLDPAAYGDRHK